MIFFFKKLINPLFFMIVIAIGLISCKRKTDFNSLTEVSYSRDISPIISSNCAYSGCHGDTNFVHFSLVTFEGLENGHIVPGSPEKSRLYQALITYGKNNMPKKPYNALTEKQIQLIYVWIGQGVKNN